MKYQFHCPWCGKRYFDFDALAGEIGFRCVSEACKKAGERRIIFSRIQGIQFVNGQRPRKNHEA